MWKFLMSGKKIKKKTNIRSKIIMQVTKSRRIHIWVIP